MRAHIDSKCPIYDIFGAGSGTRDSVPSLHHELTREIVRRPKERPTHDVMNMRKKASAKYSTTYISLRFSSFPYIILALNGIDDYAESDWLSPDALEECQRRLKYPRVYNVFVLSKFDACISCFEYIMLMVWSITLFLAIQESFVTPNG